MDNYEQKYKKALEAVKFLQEVNPSDEGIQNWVKDNFPELKESEDERIRKEFCKDIRTFIPNEMANKYIAWLEKQVEQSSDKVEPKFKVGDWIILPLGIIAHIDSLNSTDYQVTTTDGKNCDFKISKQDNYRFWTIADAKDGDILAADAIESHPSPFVAICKKQDGELFETYCFIGHDGKFYGGEIGHVGGYVHPATKEQRDLLFTNMKEVGYEWNADTKEVKKIEHKTLNADKVIEWLEEHVPTKFEDMENYVQQFKYDFGL